MSRQRIEDIWHVPTSHLTRINAEPTKEKGIYRNMSKSNVAKRFILIHYTIAESGTEGRQAIITRFASMAEAIVARDLVGKEPKPKPEPKPAALAAVQTASDRSRAPAQLPLPKAPSAKPQIEPLAHPAWITTRTIRETPRELLPAEAHFHDLYGAQASDEHLALIWIAARLLKEPNLKVALSTIDSHTPWREALIRCNWQQLIGGIGSHLFYAK